MYLKNFTMLYNVGGGAFVGNFFKTFIKDIFEPRFITSGILDKFTEAGITILGYNFVKKDFNGPFIPDTFENMTIEKERCLYVNGWGIFKYGCIRMDNIKSFY